MPLFEEFSPVTKEDWLVKIKAELRTKAPEDLDWEWMATERISPFQHQSDQAKAPAPLLAGRSQNSWSIGAYLVVNNNQKANALLLEQLMGGVNAPLISEATTGEGFVLSQLLKKIIPSYISLHFDLTDASQPGTLLEDLKKYIQQHDATKGTVSFGHLEPDWEQLDAFLEGIDASKHNWKLLAVDGRKHYQGEENIAQELAAVLLSGQTLLELGESRGIDKVELNEQLHFHLNIGASYLRNIAKIRAFKVLWANLLADYGMEEEAIPSIVAHCSIIEPSGDANTQMIRAATQAISAVVGGANRVYISPADGQVDHSFSQRIARNVQQLLQLESHLDQVVDPVAGSFYFERLTKEIANQSWSIFCQRNGQS